MWKKDPPNILYKKTKLEDTYGVNMLAIAGGRPGDPEFKGNPQKLPGLPVSQRNAQIPGAAGEGTGEKGDQGRLESRPAISSI